MSKPIVDELKHCRICREIKPRTDFYRQPNYADELDSRCKECTKEQVRRNREAKIDYYREYDRKRGARPSTGLKQWRSKNPEKYRAHSIVNNAVKGGKLLKPEHCESCGESKLLHGHHDDYSKPLDVMWLCAACHKARHKELGWGHVWNKGKDLMIERAST